MRYFILSCMLLAFLMTGCKSNKNQAGRKSKKTADFEQIAQKKFEKPYKKLYNASGSHVICYVVHKGRDNSQLQLLLFDAKTNELIYTKTKADSEVKWLTDKRIQITTPPRNPKLSAVTEVYDVEKRRNVQVNTDL